MQTALYMTLGLLVVAAVAYQVWMLRAGTQRKMGQPFVVFLKVFNIVVLLALAGLVVYVLMRR